MVEAKCMNGHTFDVTPDMVDVTKTGTSFKSTCPECGGPAQLTHKKVIEIMGLKDNAEARALKEQMAKEKKVASEASGATNAQKNMETSMRPKTINIDDDLDAEEDDYASYPPARSRDITTPPRPPAPTAHPPTTQPVVATAPGQRRERGSIDVMGVAETARSKNDILRDIIDATNLSDSVKEKVSRFIGLKPEGLTPHELYSVLTYLGIGNNPAMNVVRMYEFDLTIQQREIDQERQIYNIIGAPMPIDQEPRSPMYPGAQMPQTGAGGGGMGMGMGMGMSKGPNPFLPQQGHGAMLPGMPQQPGGGGIGGQQPVDVSILFPLAFQNPAAFQMVMANPALMQAVLQNPAASLPLLQMMPANQQQQQQQQQGQTPANGITRDEVKNLIVQEMNEIKKVLLDVRGNPKDDALIEELRQNRSFMFEMLKERANQQNAPRHDPLIEQQAQITGALLNNLLESQNRDNTGIILQALDEIKKNPSGLGSASPSVEGMNLFLRYQELMNQMDETRQRYQDEREKRDSLKDIVNTAAETVGDTIATVIEKNIIGPVGGPAPTGGGMRPQPGGAPPAAGSMRPRPPVADEPDDSPSSPPPPPPPDPEPTPRRPGDGISSIKCLNCGSDIYVPTGTERIECPSCHERFRVERTDAPPPDDPPGDVDVDGAVP